MRIAVFLCLINLAFVSVNAADELSIDYTLPRAGNVSLAIFDSQGHQVRNLLAGDPQTAGKHSATWDGLDRVGTALPPGSYTWKMLMNNGLESDFITVIGQNVADPAQPWTPTVGNHQGPSCVACGADGSVYLGSRNGEGPPVLIKHPAKPGPELWNWWWQRPGPVDMVESGKTLFVITWNSMLSFIDPATGKDLSPAIDLLWADDKRGGLDDPIGNQGMSLSVADGKAVVAYRHHNALRWFDPATQKMIREQAVEQPRAIAAGAGGVVYVLSSTRVVSITPAGKQTVIVDKGVLADPTTLDFDTLNQQIIVADGGSDQRIRRFALDGKAKGTHGRLGGRLDGAFVASDFKNVIRLRCDGKGGFFLVEFEGIRRIMHCAADGKVLKEWYGGTPFYAVASADPAAPSQLWYNASDTHLAMVEVNLDTGAWKMAKSYSMEGLGEGLFPGACVFPLWRVRRVAGQTYFYHESPPAIMRIDEAKQKLVPVALAAHKKWGATSFPSPTLNAALAAHKLAYDSQDCDGYTWSDVNGNGVMDVDEFRFNNIAVGCNGYAAFDDQFNVYFGFGSANNYNYTGTRWMEFDFQGSAYAKLPNRAAKGSATPLWDWSTVERSVSKVPADLAEKNLNMGAAATRWDPRGGVTVALRGDLGDRHGTDWPNGQAGKASLLRAMPDAISWATSKHRSEGMTGGAMLGYPVNSPGAVHGCIITCDRNTYGASAWTEDGLYAGTFLDRHVNDLPAWAYGGSRGIDSLFAGDDWECAGSMTDLADGSVLWMPRCTFGRIAVLRVRGWDNWVRSEGTLTIAKPAPAASGDGSGLAASYFRGKDFAGKAVVERTDARLWFRNADAELPRFASWKSGPCDGITAAEPFSIRWSGRLVAPLGEDYWFRIYNMETAGSFVTTQWWQDGAAFVRVWLNEVLILDRSEGALTGGAFQCGPIRLVAGQSYRLRIEYSSPGVAKPEFSLSWSRNTASWERVPARYLFPDAPAAKPVIQVAVNADDKQALTADLTLAAATKEAITVRYHWTGTDYADHLGEAVIAAGARAAKAVVPAMGGPATLTLLPAHSYFGDGSAGSVHLGKHTFADKLVACYLFDETSGDVMHDSVSGAVGRFIWFMSPPVPTWRPTGGKFGGALEFGEPGIQFDLVTPTVSGDFTYSYWIETKLPNTGLFASGFDMWIQDGIPWANFGGWRLDCSKATRRIDDGKWHHLLFAWDQTQRVQTLYVDGEPSASGPGPGQGASGGLSVGVSNNLPPTGQPFVGLLDDLRIYSRCFNADDVKSFSSSP